MIIIGAKGLAKEVLEILLQQNFSEPIFFYDDISKDLPAKLFDQYPILRNEDEVKNIFSQGDIQFTLGLGNPTLRKKMAEKFRGLGGELRSVISPYAHIGRNGNQIEEGVCIMTGAVITSEVQIGEGCLIYLNCTIAHDSILGEYCQLSPGVHINGRVKIGNETFIGSGAVILPDLVIGNHAIIGAGAVVTTNVASGTTVIGIPSKPVEK